MRNIEIDSIDTTSGVVTVTGGAFTFEDGEAAAVGDYVVTGVDSANASELPDLAERYLISYMNWKILKRDSSNDSAEAQNELTQLEADILSSFAEVDADLTLIPFIDATFVDEDF